MKPFVLSEMNKLLPDEKKVDDSLNKELDFISQ